MQAQPDHQRWRVMVVEDDARTRNYVAQCIRASRELDLLVCLASVTDALSWLAQARSPGPDVLLTDLGLPDGSGIEVIRQTLACFPKCEALVVSMFGDEEHVLASIEAGALGYLHKDSAPENMAQTILDLKRGASPISPGIARRLLMRFRQDRVAAPPQPNKAAVQEMAGVAQTRISVRETEILDLLSRGFAYSEIADLCGLSRHTVASHVKSLYRKMQVSSRGEAVFEAMQSGIIRPLADR